MMINCGRSAIARSCFRLRGRFKGDLMMVPTLPACDGACYQPHREERMAQDARKAREARLVGESRHREQFQKRRCQLRGDERTREEEAAGLRGRLCSRW